MLLVRKGTALQFVSYYKKYYLGLLCFLFFHKYLVIPVFQNAKFNSCWQKERSFTRISSTWPTHWSHLQLRKHSNTQLQFLFQTEADTQITEVFSTLPDAHLHCFIYNNRLGSSDYILNYMDTRKELTVSLGQGVPC